MPTLAHLIDCTTTGILHDSFCQGSLLTSQETIAESTTKHLLPQVVKAYSSAAGTTHNPVFIVCTKSYYDITVMYVHVVGSCQVVSPPTNDMRMHPHWALEGLLLTYDMQTFYLFSIFLWHQWRILYDSCVRKKVLYYESRQLRRQVRLSMN